MAHVFLEDGNRKVIVELPPDVPAKVGRALQGTLVLEDGAASREHCILERTPGGWQLRDLGSRNGTRLNGRVTTEATLLRPGDRIEIGAACLTYAGDGEEGERAARALESAARAREALRAPASALAQDALTGLASFPLLVHELRAKLGAAGPEETKILRPLGLLLVDLDGLGLMNDVFGFRAGDELIRLAGLELQGAVTERTSGGLVAREAGGKFAVLLPDVGVESAVELGEAIRARIAKKPLEGPLRGAAVTASVGVASAPEDATAWRELLRRAEAALARAKREGRDAVARPPAIKPSGRPGVALTGLFALPGRVAPETELAPLLKKKDHRAALALVAQALGSDLELEALVKLVLTIAIEKTGARRGFLFLKDARTGELRLAEQLDREPSRSKQVRFSHGILKEALAAPEPVIVEDATEDARFKKRASIVLEKPRSVLAAPVASPGETEPVGVLYLDDPGQVGRFTREHVDLVGAVCKLVAGAVRRWARSERTLEELARAKVVLERTAEAEALRHSEHKGLLGESEALREVHRAIDRAAASDLPVAITGESGTGKELVARAIHAASARARAPFVAESVAALTESLLEAELFGHARGAFTGAEQDRAGLFEAASGGTLFLDEVGEMSPRLQAKLLRVLQEKEVRRIGEETPRKVDIRLVTATHRDLEALAKEKQFREDLLYRIRVLTVEVPPLRDRREDIPRLLEHFLAQASAPRRAPRITRDALARLVHHDWPGNVRELENEARKLAALGSDEVGLVDLSPSIRGDAGQGDKSQKRKKITDDGALAIILACEQGRGLNAVLEDFEREAIARVLDQEGANRTLTARKLGITRQGLHKKLKRYGFS
ncbi:MAG TPA: sigma 54-interacting transcriptional regulator [Planctomycetota bacterium]|nr:sigma 54-interacting transcriptional regulator [Planctomycetota bacterium]